MLLLIFILLVFTETALASQCVLLPRIQEPDGTHTPEIPPEILAQPYAASHPVDVKAAQIITVFSDNVVIPAKYPIIPTPACKAQLAQQFPGMPTDFVDKVPQPKPPAKPPLRKTLVPAKIRQVLLWFRDTFKTAVAWAATATDDFNRADGALGANWDDGYAGFLSCEIFNNEASINGTLQSCVETYNSFTPGNNQYTIGAITVINNSDSNSQVGTTVRTATSPADQMYVCRAKGASDGTRTSRIQIRNSGSNSNIAQENATTWVVTDTIKCEAVGSTVNFYRNGSLLLTNPDPSNLFPSGRGGIFLNTPYPYNARLDNFEVGDVATGIVRRRGPIIQ